MNIPQPNGSCSTCDTEFKHGAPVRTVVSRTNRYDLCTPCSDKHYDRIQAFADNQERDLFRYVEFLKYEDQAYETRMDEDGE